MTDDDIERRLRQALRAKAEAAVDDASAVPPMLAPEPSRGRPRTASMLAAAALVVTVTGGSAALVAFTGHDGRPTVRSENSHPTVLGTVNPTGTAWLPSTSTTPVPVMSQSRRTTVSSPRSSAGANRLTSRAGHPTPPGSPTSNPSASSPGPTSTDPTRSSTTSTEPTRPSAPSSTPLTTSAPSHPAPSTTAVPQPGHPCTTAELSLEVGGDRLVGTKGGDYTYLEITNAGPTCTLDGYPTVAVSNGSGVRIGGPAVHRSSPSPHMVVLAKRASAEIELYDWNDSAPNCTSNYGVGRTLQFTPPGQSTAITIDYGYSACQLSVSAIHLPQAHPATS